MKISVVNGSEEIAPDIEELGAINGNTATINGPSGMPDFSTSTINGCPCMSMNGYWVDRNLNGVLLDTKDADETDDEYLTYMMGVAMGDPEFTTINGKAERQAKRAARKAKKEARKEKKKALLKESRTRKRLAANERKAKGEGALQKLFAAGSDFLTGMSEEKRANAEALLAEADARGIMPDPDAFADLLDQIPEGAGYRDGGGGGDGGGDKKSGMGEMMLPLGILAAVLLMKK